MPWWYLACLLAANLTLLLPGLSPVRVLGALLLVTFLPGQSWVQRFFPGLPPLFRWTLTAAFSYGLAILTTLLLYYLPGPIHTWQLLVGLNLLAILPYFFAKIIPKAETLPTPPPLFSPGPLLQPSNLPLLLILLIAIFLRTANLNYSEFQGDEALAMVAAAEGLEGHEDALFLRSKGPGEVLLPMAVWRLTGAIDEATARLPFTIAAAWAVITIYLIGLKLGGQKLGWLAAGFFALNGFMVAFGRIVQYQALVIWFSALAFLLMLHWAESRQLRLTMLAGLSVGLGLLAHYDAVLVIPALLWILIMPQPTIKDKTISPAFLSLRALTASLKPAAFLLTTLLLTALPFYLPFMLDPQANRTGDYLGGRIGAELRNNLPDFLHFNTFYSSSYYLIVTGLLVLGLLAWLISRLPWLRWPGAAVLTVSAIAVTLNPTLLVFSGTLNLSFLPFALLLFGALLALYFQPLHPSISPPSFFLFPTSALLIWLAIPFLGYNFIVALGLTHIYTIVPAWSLMAALGWFSCFDTLHRRTSSHFLFLISNVLLGVLALLSTLFLWNAFVRHDVEYWQDYPAGKLPLYWDPYPQPPQAGFFGFAHRTGWKAIGQQIATGALRGDYGSNEEPDITAWYTRGAPRACDPQPEFYFLADDLIDPVEVPTDLLESSYERIGAVTLPNQKQMRIMQLRPPALTIGELADEALARDFDQSATPAAFARSARGSVPVETNFGNLVRLIGYDLDTRRAYPGGRVPVTLYWQALAAIPTSYQVFTHLESESGPAAQADGVPVCWSYPTDRWRPGQIIADQHAIYLPPEVAPGTYPLQVGLYTADNFQRLDVLDAAGNPAGTSVTLTEVNLKTAP